MSRSFATGTAPALKASGTTGAPNPGRFVGVTTTGTPTTGTYNVGDFIVTQNGQMFVCVTAGTPGTWVTPADTRNLLTVGEEAVSRDISTLTTLGQTSGVVRLTYFTCRKTETTTQIRFIGGGTAAAATPTLVRWGLYEIAANGNGTLVASIASDTTLFASANGTYTRSWTTPYAKTAGTRYAAAFLIVTGAATPSLAGASLGPAAEGVIAPQIAGQITGQTDLPASFAAASSVASGQRPYSAILP